MNPFTQVLWADQEVQRDRRYFWNNWRRYSVDRLVIQRTLSGTAFFEDHQGRRMVPAGHAMLFTYHEKSSYGYPKDATEPYSLIYFNLAASASMQPLFEALRKNFGAVVRLPEGSESGACFEQIFTHFKEHSFRDELHQSELVGQLFHRLYREQQESASTTDPISSGHNLIRTRFRLPMNLKTLAEQCGVSREHFIRSFRKRYGDSPGAVLREFRLQHGREILALTTLSVEDVARECGFTSSNSFSRAYRQRFGRNPQSERPERGGHGEA